jgi:ubiquinone biosynthesis protein
MLIYEVARQASKGHLQVRLATDEMIKEIHREIRRASLRATAAIAGAALLVGSAIIYGMNSYVPIMWAGVPLLSWLLAGIGVVFIIVAWRLERN